jgi:hypothetical protein
MDEKGQWISKDPSSREIQQIMPATISIEKVVLLPARMLRIHSTVLTGTLKMILTVIARLVSVHLKSTA